MDNNLVRTLFLMCCLVSTAAWGQIMEPTKYVQQRIAVNTIKSSHGNNIEVIPHGTLLRAAFKRAYRDYGFIESHGITPEEVDLMKEMDNRVVYSKVALEAISENFQELCSSFEEENAYIDVFAVARLMSAAQKAESEAIATAYGDIISNLGPRLQTLVMDSMATIGEEISYSSLDFEGLAVDVPQFTLSTIRDACKRFKVQIITSESRVNSKDNSTEDNAETSSFGGEFYMESTP